MLNSDHHAEIARWQDAIRAARCDGARLQIRGGASKSGLSRGPDSLVAAARPVDAADTRPIREHSSKALAGILSYEPSELVITALAGTPLAEIEAALAAHGQALAFEPPRRRAFATPNTDLGSANTESASLGPTWGGVVASGLAGPARASAGGVRDFVLGAGFVNGKGEHLIYGGQVMKNVAGYDVSRLLAGSWGRLGWITQASLKVLPQALAECSLRVACSAQQALDWLNAWGGQPLPLSASCWQRQGGAGQLTLRLRGAKAAVASAQTSLMRQMGSGSVQLATDQAARFWDAQRDGLAELWQRPASDEHSLWRINAPQTAPASLCDAEQIDHHGAQRWLWADAAQSQSLHERCRRHAAFATEFIARKCQNTPTCIQKHSINTASGSLYVLQDRVLRAFDPDAVFVP